MSGFKRQGLNSTEKKLPFVFFFIQNEEPAVFSIVKKKVVSFVFVQSACLMLTRLLVAGDKDYLCIGDAGRLLLHSMARYASPHAA